MVEPIFEIGKGQPIGGILPRLPTKFTIMNIPLELRKMMKKKETNSHKKLLITLNYYLTNPQGKTWKTY